VKSCLAVLRETKAIKALAHITGGGFPDNIPRVLPAGLEVRLERAAWPRDPVFDWLAQTGNISDTEMYRTFNCGIGMVIILPAAAAAAALELLHQAGEGAQLIGEVQRGDGGVIIRA